MVVYCYARVANIRFGKIRQNNRRASVPRHREIPEFTAIRICKQLEVPPPPT